MIKTISKTIEKRKKKYAEPLQDLEIDLDDFRNSLGKGMLTYILDEYMLCKNNLRLSEISEKLNGMDTKKIITLAKMIARRASRYAMKNKNESGEVINFRQLKAIDTLKYEPTPRKSEPVNDILNQKIARIKASIIRLNVQNNILGQLEGIQLIAFNSLFPELSNGETNLDTIYYPKQFEKVQTKLLDQLDTFLTTKHTAKLLLAEFEDTELYNQVMDKLQTDVLTTEYLNNVIFSDNINAREQFKTDHHLRIDTIKCLEDTIFDLIDKIKDKRAEMLNYANVVLDFIDSCDTTAVDGTEIKGIDFLLKIFAPKVLTEDEQHYLTTYMLDPTFDNDKALIAEKEYRTKQSILAKLMDYKQRKATVDEIVYLAGGYQRIITELVPKLNDEYKSTLFNEVLSYFPTAKGNMCEVYGKQEACMVKNRTAILLNKLS